MSAVTDATTIISRDTATVAHLLRRGWVRVVVCALVGLALGGVYHSQRHVSYTSAAYLVVVPVAPAPLGSGQADGATPFGQVFARIAGTPAVLAGAAGALPDGMSVDAAAKRVDFTASPNAPLVQVSGTAETADAAAMLTNVVADAVVAYADERQSVTRYGLRKIVTAVPPSAPSSPSAVLVLLIGATLGMTVGVIAALAGQTAPVQPVATTVHARKPAKKGTATTRRALPVGNWEVRAASPPGRDMS
jgi:capsular polysaccharide biosynthesis protein